MTGLDDNTTGKPPFGPPNWPFMLGAFAFVGPIAVATLNLVGPFVMKLKHGIALSTWREGFAIHGTVFVLSMAALVGWAVSYRWYVNLANIRQKLLAALCWVLTLLGYGVCLILFY